MKKKVLIVDDEEDFSTLISIRLNEGGYEVYSESEGKNVIKRVKEIKPDLVVLDIFLLGMDGLTILQKLKKEGIENVSLADIPVIVVTGKAVLMNEIFEVEGCVGFFRKPIDVKKLVTRVKELIGESE